MTDRTRSSRPGDDVIDGDVLDDDGLDDGLDDLDPDPDLLEPSTLAWRRRTAIEMAISGTLGLLASFVLSIEAITIAADPKATLSCDLSSVISCGVVARTWQAHLLGFPNAFLGIAAEAVVITIAVAMVGGVRFPRWYMLSAQAIYTLGFVFAWWLFFEAYFVIKALCPWCLLITVTTTLVWAGLTRINVRDRVIDFPGRAGGAARRFVEHGNDWFVTAALLVLLAAAVMLKYGTSLL